MNVKKMLIHNAKNKKTKNSDRLINYGHNNQQSKLTTSFCLFGFRPQTSHLTPKAECGTSAAPQRPADLMLIVPAVSLSKLSS